MITTARGVSEWAIQAILRNPQNSQDNILGGGNHLAVGSFHKDFLETPEICDLVIGSSQDLAMIPTIESPTSLILQDKKHQKR